jgi:small subunit ribosomal protein S19
MAKKKGGSSAKASRRRARKKADKIGTRRKKEFSFRGYSVEELKTMPQSELVSLMPARVRRTLSRGYNEEQQRFIEAIRKNKKEVLRTHHRDIIVMPDFIGKKIAIYDGKEFKQIEIIPEMIGHYLGEFALTRNFSKHSGPGVGATRSSKYMPLK